MKPQLCICATQAYSCVNAATPLTWSHFGGLVMVGLTSRQYCGIIIHMMTFSKYYGNFQSPLIIENTPKNLVYMCDANTGKINIAKIKWCLLLDDGCKGYTLWNSQSYVYIEDISWPRGDTNFIFECWKYLSRVSEANEWEILSAREDKIRIPKRPWNVLFII